MASRMPEVLLVTTRRWVSAARLALALRKYGCRVSTAVPWRHPIRHTSLNGQEYRYRGLSPIRSISKAIASARPDLIVPCDDLARLHLNEIYALECRRNPASPVASLIQRSLGDPAGFDLVLSRSEFITLAQTLGIAAPDTRVVGSLEQLRAAIDDFGLPIVLKTSGTSGGTGVRIARNAEEGERFFRQLDAPPRTDRTWKRALVDHDASLIRPWAQRTRPVVNAQAYLPMRDATIAVACWEGRILASISVEVLRTFKAAGPSSVVRMIENDAMLSAAEKLVSHLKLSGLHGFDFLLEEKTRKPWLIEMNARATQTCYLPLGPGRNLCAALADTLAGRPLSEVPSITDRSIIALFPQEWINDPASPYLHTAYHDVPWEEPALVQAGVTSRMRGGGWLTYESLDRLMAQLRGFGRTPQK